MTNNFENIWYDDKILSQEDIEDLTNRLYQQKLITFAIWNWHHTIHIRKNANQISFQLTQKNLNFLFLLSFALISKGRFKNVYYTNNWNIVVNIQTKSDVKAVIDIVSKCLKYFDINCSSDISTIEILQLNQFLTNQVLDLLKPKTLN